MSEKHPASQYALDPDGILLKYGPEAVMEHYYCDHSRTTKGWVRCGIPIIREVTKEWTKEEILKDLKTLHSILKSKHDAREGRGGLI